jgi:phenylacetaldehyde dehydrogenase
MAAGLPACDRPAIKPRFVPSPATRHRIESLMNALTPSRPAYSAQAMAFLKEPHRPFIDGAFQDAKSDEIIPIENPAREEIVAQVQAAGEEDLDLAVAAARRAFRTWSVTPGNQRARVLLRFADILDERADIIGEIETIEAGLPISMSVPTIRSLCGEVLRYYAGWATKLEGATIPTAANGREHLDFLVYTLREPVGVVGAILPWNAPVGMIIMKLAPALAAGCTMILKSAELAPLTAELLAAAWRDAGGPDGVFNVLHGYGRTTGAALVRHPGIDKIVFTGSSAVGKEIARAAADNLRGVNLELGGKSPFVIFPDAPLDEAIPVAAMACFLMSGQNCMAGTRLFVHESVKDEVMAGIIATSENFPIGDGLRPETFIGPLISAAQKRKVQGFIDGATAEGARLIHSGAIPAGAGHYVGPTIIDRVTPSMTIAREEVFGPVLAVQTFGDDEDALAAAIDDTVYGLSGSIWTNDLRRAHRFVRRIDSGQVGVNVHAAVSPETPFGGNRQSGLGNREFGREGIEGYLKTKAVSVNLGPR